MWLIAGLGNPGNRYVKTRHNVGFDLIDRLADANSIDLKERNLCLRGGGLICDIEVVLLKPLTYMNRSGFAVKETLHDFSIPLTNLIVVHDDLDLDIGRIKLRKNGSSGGHRGIDSIIAETGSRDFIRLKIGIGRNPLIPSDVYVLSRFAPEDRVLIEKSLDLAVDALEETLARGVESAMNLFNQRDRRDRNRDAASSSDKPKS